MSDLFREIDSELRQDKAREWLATYGPHLIAGAIFVVVVVSVGVWWQSSQIERNQADTTGLLELIGPQRDVRPFDIEDALSFSAEAGDSHAAIARLHAAGALIDNGDLDAALAEFAAVAASDDLPQIWRDLARLQSVMARADVDEPQVLLRELAPLTAVDAAWRYSALELRGLLEIRAGDRAAGRSTLQELAVEQGLPAAMRGRILRWLELYPEEAGGNGGEQS